LPSVVRRASLFPSTLAGAIQRVGGKINRLHSCGKINSSCGATRTHAAVSRESHEVRTVSIRHRVRLHSVRVVRNRLPRTNSATTVDDVIYPSYTPPEVRSQRHSFAVCSARHIPAGECCFGVPIRHQERPPFLASTAHLLCGDCSAACAASPPSTLVIRRRGVQVKTTSCYCCSSSCCVAWHRASPLASERATRRQSVS
jgi:hypothetical protein